MNSLKKTHCILLLFFITLEIFPQNQSYISTNGSINNSFPKKSIYYVLNISPLANNNSAQVLDSLICIYLNGDRIRIAYSYNDDLSLNYFTIADWFNGEWIISDKHTNTYNSNGNLESVLWEWFNPLLQEWLKDAKDVYNYDSLGNRVNFLHQVYNGQEFINNFRYEYFYNNTNKVILSLEEFWNNGKWVNDSKTIYSYNNTNLKDTTLLYDWKNDKWVNNQLNIYDYDEKLNIISNLAKRWQEENWLDFGMGTFEYDLNNNCTLEIWEIANNNNWENWFRIFYEYDDNNNLIHLFGEEWKNDQWVPENELLIVINPNGISFGYLAKEIFLYYSEPTSVASEKNIVNGFNLFQNYPNPFNPTTTIKYSIPQRSIVNITVYNILGKKIITLVNEEKQAGNYEIKFDGSNFPSGVYFYKMQTNASISSSTFTETKKFILLK